MSSGSVWRIPLRSSLHGHRSYSIPSSRTPVSISPTPDRIGLTLVRLGYPKLDISVSRPNPSCADRPLLPLHPDSYVEPVSAERSMFGSCSIRDGMPTGSIPGRADFRLCSFQHRLSPLHFAISRLRPLPSRRPSAIHVSWHRARTPRFPLPSL